MKFDVIVGNPPYNPPVKNKKSHGGAIYDKFILQALACVNLTGYICYVHPPNWRKPEGRMKIWECVRDLQFLRLEIYNTKDGIRTFGAGTRYDWYVLQNTPVSKPTPVRDEEGNEIMVDFREWNWLPNGCFKEIRNLLATKGVPPCPISKNSTYSSSNKGFIAEEQSEKFCFPVVHATNKDGPRWLWSSRNDKGHFGVSKVIFGEGGINDPIVDLKGEYGVSANAMAIEVRDAHEAELIRRALTSKSFAKVIALTKWSNFRVEWRMFRDFRRDWHLQFQD